MHMVTYFDQKKRCFLIVEVVGAKSGGSHLQPKFAVNFTKVFGKPFLQNTSGQPYLAHFPLSLASPTQSQAFAMIFLIYFFYLPNIFQTIIVSTCNLNPLRALMQIIQILSRTIIHRNYCKRIVLTIFSKPGFYF